MADTMKATVFHGKNGIRLEEVPIPKAGYGEAVVKVTMTTICGTDVHIMKGEYPVREGLIIGHEAVGVIHELGPDIVGYKAGERVIVGAITPCGTCSYCQSGHPAQCGGYDDKWIPIGGWRLGNSTNGVQAEYFKVPYAQANMAKIPDDLRDEDVLLCSDVASTGISGAESADIQIGDIVVVYAQGPIGLSATAGARLRGASLIIGVDSLPNRLEMSKKMGADVVINYKEQDPVTEVLKLTDGRGADVAIEALGLQSTFENCLRSVRPGGTVSTLGVYSGQLSVPVEPFVYGIGDIKIVSTLCPGGKDRMYRLMNMVRYKRVNFRQMFTHHFLLDNILDAYELFSHQRENVLKVAVTPQPVAFTPSGKETEPEETEQFKVWAGM